MATSTFKLYTIEGIDYDAVIIRYRALCEQGVEIVDANSISVNIGDMKYIQVRKPRKPLNNDTKIKNKTMYIVHSIAYRQATSMENSTEGAIIKYSILQGVIGEDTYELLKALKELGYILISNTYIVGKSSKHYKVNGNILTVDCSNFTIRKYINKTKELLRNTILKRITTPEFKSMYGDSFAETYIKNLNKFRIKDKIGYSQYTKEQVNIYPTKETYYNFIKESFNNDLKIYSIDDNNRIYHLLTSLERELKQFVNIKYSIDCKNSHPLLFNYFIFNSKGITIDISYFISSILYSIDYSSISCNNHYDIEKLRNILKDNNIDESIIAIFAPDELLYLWETTTGRFWDDILREHHGYDRAEIKQKMFAEVFYSKTPKIAWKEFAKEFKQQYPNVYALILRWKAPLKHNELKSCLLARKKAVQLKNVALMPSQDTALPNIMMDLESEIFREILKSLYRKRIPVVHIHDAIVVPQTRAVIDITKVEEVMRKTYKQFGLHPTFSVDTYN